MFKEEIVQAGYPGVKLGLEDANLLYKMKLRAISEKQPKTSFYSTL